VKVEKISDAKNTSENWFDFSLPINSGLTAIIGNKGSGKSALSDIIGHFCNCKSVVYASFLHKDRFRKEDKKLSSDYSGTIKWTDSHVEEKRLLADYPYSTVEKAQYLPQKYIETTCNNLGDEFQNEINSVIFSYIDIEEKEKCLSLNDLIEKQSESILDDINKIKLAMDNINRDIINIELKMTPLHQKQTREALIEQENVLKRHEANKPIEVKAPAKGFSPEQQQKITAIDSQITNLTTEVKNGQEELKSINIQYTDLSNITKKITSLNKDTESINIELEKISAAYNFDAKKLKITLQFPHQIIKSKMDILTKRKEILSTLLNKEDEALDKSLFKQIDQLKTERANIVASTDSEQKAYQKYLTDLKEWNDKKQKIIGDKETEATIEFLKNEINNIESIYQQQYRTLKSNRKSCLLELYSKKQEILEIYESLYAPIKEKLSKIMSDSDNKITFDINITLSDKELSKNFLTHINQAAKGHFNGKVEGLNQINTLISNVDFNTPENAIKFIEDIIKSVAEPIDENNKQIKNKEALYKLICHLDYLSINYNLKMGNVGLQRLSPGERGLVLLIFYLGLTKNNIPLIIDQPEDNLDNQSVFKRLVPCIKEAKQRRQIIIVTHNPNIAIACDAEQIIYSEIDKNTNSISYMSGSIGNKEIRQKVVNVLEGTMPAFNLRKEKYTNSNLAEIKTDP
jgi:ABC-type lipoprotein export system ATPase subunit